MASRLSLISLGLLLFVLSFACYYSTLAPTITWENDGVDSGDLVTAVYTLGIAHPPGYPLYVLLGKAFALLPAGEVAHRVNLMSAFFAAGTVSLIYGTVLKLLPGDVDGASAVIIAAASALLLAFSHTFWYQAIIAEVYSLNAFLVAAMIYLATLFRSTGDRWLLWLLCLISGLSLGNHLSALLLLSGLLFLILTRTRPRRATVLGMAGCFLLGLSIYVYLPLRAVENPPVNWGDPDTWSRFWWTVSGSIYRDYAFAVPLAYLPGRILSWINMLGQQFTWLGLGLALVGIWELWQNDRDYLIFSSVSFGLIVVYALAYNTTDSYVYLIPSYLLFCLWVARGASFLLGDVLYPWITEKWGLASRRPQVVYCVSLSLLLLPMILVGSNYADLDLSDDRTAHAYAAQVFADTSSEALIIADTDAHIFSLWHFRYVATSEREAAVVAKGLYQYDWYRVQGYP